VSDVRSYSQLGSYDRCPYMYYLERVEKVWQRPAAWLPMGTAVHEAAEAFELSKRTMTLEEAQQVFLDAYSRETNRILAEVPNANYWFASGPYKGPADIVRRQKLGLEHVERYIAWYAKHPEQKPIEYTDLEGNQKIGVELPFTLEIGGVPVRGFIDWVGWDKGQLIVRDNKTGRLPGGPDQLATYALAVEDKFGNNPDIWPPGQERIAAGDFFMTRTGKPTVPYALTRAVKVQLSEDFATMDEGVKAGNFPAKPEASKCMFCSVNASCKYRV
jgi:putative RecB family exonuclease